MLYFAFGSNMLKSRMQKRVPSAIVSSTATLLQHVFKFHKRSKDGSTKADAMYTGNINDTVHGVLYTMSRADKSALDAVEGRHYGYEQKWVYVTDVNGIKRKAFMYYATDIDINDVPFSWYKQTVVDGARLNNIDPVYVDFLRNHKSKVATRVVTCTAQRVQSYSRFGTWTPPSTTLQAPEADFPRTALYDMWDQQEQELLRQADEHLARERYGCTTSTKASKKKISKKKSTKRTKRTIINRRTGIRKDV